MHSYMSSFWMYNTWTYLFLNDINHTTLEDGIGYIYFGNLVDNIKYAPIRLLEKNYKKTVHTSSKTIDELLNKWKLQGDE